MVELILKRMFSHMFNYFLLIEGENRQYVGVQASELKHIMSNSNKN